MFKFIKKYFILIFLLLLVVVLVVLKIFYGAGGDNDGKSALMVTPALNKIITPVVTEYATDDPKSEEGFVDILPYKGKKMQITGYSKPGVLEVVIRKEEDKTEAEKEVKEWMEIYPIFKSNTYIFVVKSN